MMVVFQKTRMIPYLRQSGEDCRNMLSENRLRLIFTKILFYARPKNENPQIKPGPMNGTCPDPPDSAEAFIKSLIDHPASDTTDTANK